MLEGVAAGDKHIEHFGTAREYCLTNRFFARLEFYFAAFNEVFEHHPVAARHRQVECGGVLPIHVPVYEFQHFVVRVENYFEYDAYVNRLRHLGFGKIVSFHESAQLVEPALHRHGIYVRHEYIYIGVAVNAANVVEHLEKLGFALFRKAFVVAHVGYYTAAHGFGENAVIHQKGYERKPIEFCRPVQSRRVLIANVGAV